MLTRVDVERIEKCNDVMFDKGKVVGEVIKKNSIKVLRCVAIVGIVIFIGSLMFLSGVFSSRKDIPLQPLDNK